MLSKYSAVTDHRATNADILDSRRRVLGNLCGRERPQTTTHTVIGDDGGMPRVQNTYDHRLRDLVQRTRDMTLATSAGVPRSTASGWLREPNRTTISIETLSMEEQDL